ncbi:MAG TPA: methyltransferase dimerization domain-containing protein, partial [Streptosporangiaceae bacterium]
MTNDPTTPDAIMRLGLGFWGSKALLSAVELDLFTTLAEGSLTGETLTAKLGLQHRGSTDWLDALVSLGMLERTGGEYANTAATALFLDRTKPSYIGGILEMANARLYSFWGSLTEALRTGSPQNEAKAGEDFFAALYRDQPRLKQFLRSMTALSMGAAQVIAEKFPWERHHTVIDVGAAEGCVPVQLALRHPHLTGGGFDLPATERFFN